MLYSRSRARSRLARRLSWLVVASLVVAAFAPAAAFAADAVAPVANDNACNNVESGSDSPLVWLTTSAEGLTVNWNTAEPPAGFGTDGSVVVRACVDGEGAWSQNDTNDGVELFSWSLFGLTGSPCPGDAVLGGSVDGGTPFVNTQKQNGISCTSEPTATPTVAPTATPTVAPTATPTVAPTATPTVAPTATPTVAPTATPTVAPTATPTVAPTATPTVAPTATPGPPTQFAFPTIGLTDCTVTGGQGSIIVSGFAATNGGELVLNPGAGEIVITANGTYPLAPGTYPAIIRFAGETVAGPTQLVIGACPEGTPAPDVTASILIAKFDTRGTADTDDDLMLDGASFDVYLDDGDETFDAGDELVFGPATTTDGLLDTDLLEAGQYWIVESVVPTGFTGSDPILVDLNTDSSATCVWDTEGLIECEENVGNVDDLSWTIVLVDNTPIASTPAPTGGVGGATGTPGGPGVTLPPTDTLSDTPSAPASDGWRLILLAMAGLMAAALMLTPAKVVVRKDDRRR